MPRITSTKSRRRPSPLPPSQRKRKPRNDVAHAPGHRRLDLKAQAGKNQGSSKSQASALQNYTPADRINRTTAQIRISGFVSSAGSRRQKGAKTAH